MKTIVVAFLIALAATASAAETSVLREGEPEVIAAVPRVINYQGVLNDNTGTPVSDGYYDLTFRLYDAESDGNLLWTELHGDVQTADGHFSVNLGSIALPFNDPYYLSIQVESDPEMTPRYLLASAPYSLRSDTADVAVNAINGTLWDRINNVIYTKDQWGISIGDAENVLYGSNSRSHVNLGYACTTGSEINNWSYCVVSGGWGNRSSGLYSNVGGGYSNKASESGSSVVGGTLNSASGSHSSIVNGYSNTATSEYSHVGTGYYNTASDYSAVVGGGRFNEASAFEAHICNGDNNTASYSYAFIGNGIQNTASGGNSFIGNGYYNHADGSHSAIICGYADTLGSGAQFSLAVGYDVYSNDNLRALFFNGLTYGSVNINRDGHDGAVTTYPLHIGTTTGNGNGAYLTAGGVWTNGSSRSFKENFTPFDGEELLSKISDLSVTAYNYKNSTEKHVGPVAEEFVRAFDTGVIRETDSRRDDQYLAASDVAGVALAGVQELLKKIEVLEKRIAELEAEQR